MPREKAKKMISFDASKLEAIMKQQNVGKLTLEDNDICSRKTLMRSTTEKRISKDTLLAISEFLNVNPRVFSDSMASYGYEEFIKSVFCFYEINTLRYREAKADLKVDFLKELLQAIENVLEKHFPNAHFTDIYSSCSYEDRWGYIWNDIDSFEECEIVRDKLIANEKSSRKRRILMQISDEEIYHRYIDQDNANSQQFEK